MSSNVAKWFWVWCQLNNISTVFEATFSHISPLRWLCRTSLISVFLFLGIRLKTKTHTWQKILFFKLFILKIYQIHTCLCCSFLMAHFVYLTILSVISMVSVIFKFSAEPYISAKVKILNKISGKIFYWISDILQTLLRGFLCLFKLIFGK